ncbi:MAG: 30S ribosomal protein S9 [Candidatus Mesenet longicola]|uniref:Small ribosomal subunit protein uS9 n=1 Tax=Candidatus Mesenet longicola TaxID=1892558 RepID=A0A8J3HQ63_9RICK|nr:MAG: 30S ribosomal protein S9 [Candidatus Mesenet longicola]GHM59578.1 MAG: 30S ribosomal protein S9 [Candidatus Mesenet longicola]
MSDIVNQKENLLKPHTGRRKEATARVWIKPGTGEFVVKRSRKNKEDALSYLKRKSIFRFLQDPFIATSTFGKYDVIATVKGGGLSGQAGALAHGISRALVKMRPDLHSILRNEGFLTRDSRKVERKKPGLHKARKRPQFSKR